MRKKLLSMLALLCLTVASAWGAKTVTITYDDLYYGIMGHSCTIDCVTLSVTERLEPKYIEGYPITISTSEGHFTRIEISADVISISGDGWEESTKKSTWTGNASSVSFDGLIRINITIKCTIETTYVVKANQADGAYWSTFYSNEANYQAPEGTQVFAVNLDGDAIEMTEISDRIVVSGQGVVLKSTSGSITMTRTNAAPAGDFSGNSLMGTMSRLTNPGNAYVLNKGTNGVGFYRLASSGTIGANKAYLIYSGSLVREFFLFEDDATGINEELRSFSSMKSMKNEESSIYNLAGQRIQKMQKGINIVNGKKVLK